MILIVRYGYSFSYQCYKFYLHKVELDEVFLLHIIQALPRVALGCLHGAEHFKTATLRAQISDSLGYRSYLVNLI